MTVQQLLHRALWILPLALQAVVAIVMLMRGLHKQLPYFFCYTTYVVLSNILLLAILKYPNLYFWAYWVQGLIGWSLGFAVIYEIYATLLREYTVLQKTGAYLFWITGILLVTVAVSTAVSAPGSDTSRILQTLYTLQRGVRLVEFGLLIALFVFASFFGLSWKNYVFGIALGFAIYLSIQLAVVAIRAYAGKNLDQLVSWLQSIAYTLGILVWAFYLVRRWQPAELRLIPRPELAAWNDTLRDLLHR